MAAASQPSPLVMPPRTGIAAERALQCSDFDRYRGLNGHAFSPVELAEVDPISELDKSRRVP